MHAGALARPGSRRGRRNPPSESSTRSFQPGGSKKPRADQLYQGEAALQRQLRPQDRRRQMEGQGWGQGLASSLSRSPLPRTSAQVTRLPSLPAGQARLRARVGAEEAHPPTPPRSPYLVGRRPGKPSWGTRRSKPRTGPKGKQRVGQLHEDSETRAAMSTAAPFLCPLATGGSHGFPQKSSQATISHKPQWNGPGSHSKPGRSLAQELGRVPTQPLIRWPWEHQQRQGGRGGRRGGRKLAPDPLIDWFQQL